ncbi:uncharacterized protein LOC134755351 [Cydia strobilella]|uniref:uncharacterized protein LOC134755351 n=1 Tax=Cydia strobilella TaxID=1100964 RepID=UPI0030065AB0
MVANGRMEKKPSTDKIPTTATLDEAMLEAGLGLYNIAHMLMSGVILMGVIMQTVNLAYVIPAAQCDLNLSIETKGWLAATPFTSMILTSHMWGYLADTRGRRPVMMVSMLVSVLFSILASFAPNLPVFAVLTFFSAVFMSGPSAVVYTYLGEFNNLEHRDKMVAFGASFVGIGTVLLPGVAWLILPQEFAWPISWLGIVYRPWRLLVAAAALPYTLGAVLLFLAPESPKFLYAQGKYDECLATVKHIYGVNKWIDPETFPIKTLVVDPSAVTASSGKGITAVLSSMWDQTAPLFKGKLLKWTCLTCFVQYGIFSAANGFYVWFPSILNSLANHNGAKDARICEILDASQKAAANATDVVCDDTMNTETFERSIYIGLVFCSMYIVVGFIVDFVGKKLILLTILGVSGLCGIITHLASNQQTAVVLFAVFQMSGACIGIMNAMAVELFPTRYRAMAICLSMMMGRVGSVVGSNLIGVFMRVNCGISFYLFGGLLLACCAVCLTLPGKKTRVRHTKKSVAPAQNETHEPV